MGKEGRTCIFQRSPAAASLLYAQRNPQWRCGVPAAQPAALEAARILTCSPRSGKPRASTESRTATVPAEPGGFRPQFQDPPTVSEPTNLRPGSGPAHFCTHERHDWLLTCHFSLLTSAAWEPCGGLDPCPSLSAWWDIYT